MKSEPMSISKHLEDAELDRLAFLVYKKAMSLIGYTITAFSLGLAIFAFFGFSKWKDLSDQLDRIEERADAASASASIAESKLADFESDLSSLRADSHDVAGQLRNHGSALRETFIETGKMIHVKDEIDKFRSKVDNDVKQSLTALEVETGKALTLVQQERAQTEQEVTRARADADKLQRELRDNSDIVASKVAQVLDAGSTIAVFQAKNKNNKVSVNGTDIQVALGKAVKGQVENVTINYDNSGNALTHEILKENQEVQFSRTDENGIKRRYTFRILNINLLFWRDLITCEIRWEIEPNRGSAPLHTASAKLR